MKSTLRTIFASATIILSAFTAVSLSSCDSDKCKTIACAHGGTCTDGACTCPAGYEGPQCETINYERYLGSWNVKEDGTRSNASQYNVTVDKTTDITKIAITNFRNLIREDVIASIKGDTLRIAEQTFNGYKVQGWGILSDDPHYGEHGSLILYYSLTQPDGQVDDYGLAVGNPSVWYK